MSKSQRAYCFTSFDSTKPVFNPENCRYLIFQEEECPETFNLHFQGYAEFPKKITIKSAMRILNISKGWLEPRYGSREEARDYCKKSRS